MKESTTVGTLNVTTLKLEGEDEFSIRRCTRFCEILSFMVEKGVDVLCLQETRFKFSDDTCEDGVLYRKVENLGCTFHIYLQSATGGDSCNGMGIVSRRVLSRVRKVSDRIMSAGYHLNEGKGTVSLR